MKHATHNVMSITIKIYVATAIALFHQNRINDYES